MTPRQMASLLRKEGWTSQEPDWWIDPHTEFSYGEDAAYRLAVRRRADRERRALKKAGFKFCRWSDGTYSCAPGWREDGEFPITRAEALAQIQRVRK